MGRKKIKFDEQAFRQLDRLYRDNDSGDPLVTAFNALPADDRAVMLAYIVVKKNKSALANMFGVSFRIADERLWRIQVKVQEHYRRLVEDADFCQFS